MNLGEYCNREVIIMRREETARDAARIMREQHVGDVVVVDDSGGSRTPLGIVTDRDLVIEILAVDGDPDTITLGDMISGELVCGRESDDLRDSLHYMRSHGVRRLPVVGGDGDLIGIITLDDYIDLLAEELEELATLIRREQGRERAVRSRP